MERKHEILAKIQQKLQKADMRAELQEEIVRFIMNGIGEREEWKALGEVSFVPYAATGEQEEILQIYLTIAKNIDGAKHGKISEKLMELNNGVLFGRIGLDNYGQLFYLSRIPVVGDNAEMAAGMFEFVAYEMFTFLDAFYAYILVMINEPDKLTLKRYMELMIEENDEQE